MDNRTIEEVRKVKIGFPVEYEDENNIARNGLFLREPEIKELKKRLKEINRIIDLKQQCKKQKEVIDKAIKLIKYNEKYRDGADCCQFVDIVSEILDPLQNILEQDETTNNAYLKEFEDWLKEVSE